MYNLEIEEAHCFYANGLLVKNCHDALQYLCLLVDDVTGSRRLVEPPPPVPTWAAMV